MKGSNFNHDLLRQKTLRLRSLGAAKEAQKDNMCRKAVPVPLLRRANVPHLQSTVYVHALGRFE